MTRIPVKDGVQIDEDHRFEKRDWRVQRIGWFAMLALVGASLTGVFGRGPLARRSAQLEGGATLRYDAIVRHESPNELVIDAAADDADSVVVAVSRAFVDGVDLRYVAPEPLNVVAAGDAVRFVIARARGVPARVRIAYEPLRYWTRRGWVQVDGGPRAPFSQFVLP